MPPSRLAIDLAERAVELDVARAFSDAATAYDDAATQLEVESSTADDANALLDKAREYRARAEEIRRTRARNGDASSSDRSNAKDEARASASGSSVVAGAAAVGAAAGFALLGPMSAVIGAGAMAYGTTRKDGRGKACKGAGAAAAASYASLRRLDDEYGLASARLSRRAARPGRETTQRRLQDHRARLHRRLRLRQGGQRFQSEARGDEEHRSGRRRRRRRRLQILLFVSRRVDDRRASERARVVSHHESAPSVSLPHRRRAGSFHSFPASSSTVDGARLV